VHAADALAGAADAEPRASEGGAQPPGEAPSPSARASSVVFSRLSCGHYPDDSELVGALATLLEGAGAPTLTFLPRLAPA
jgi:hypothetical protein